MKYNFDEIIERRGTNSVKWDGVKNIWGRDDLLPMWVADMDFRTPPFVMDALKKRLEHEVLGYTFACEEWYTSICAWLRDRHGWDISREMLTFVPGIVRGQAFALQCFTNPGDKVMVMTPVYHPFFLVTERMGREVVYSPLELCDGQYHIDFDRFRKDIQGCKVLILCNPHNPAGRVWTREELSRIGKICIRNGLIVVSDEIHCELVFPGYTFTPFASISEEFLRHSVTCLSPSKAFNIAGLQIANIVCYDENLRRMIDRAININEVCDVNPFGVIATIAAYNEGEEWLSQLIDYLWQNYLYMKDFCGKYLPDFPITLLEGTYLVSEAMAQCRNDVWSRRRRLHALEYRLSTFLADKGGGAVQGFCRLCLLKNSDDRKREKGKTSIAFPFFHISLTR
mgnify:CR=1 FL=1